MERDHRRSTNANIQEKLTAKGMDPDCIRTYKILKSGGKVPPQIALKLAAGLFASKQDSIK